PHQELLKDNTPDHLVEDIETLRDVIGIEKGEKAHILGGSWGSMLALLYSMKHPEHVKSITLRGQFLGRKEDLDYLYGGGFEVMRDRLRQDWTPEVWAAVEKTWNRYIEILPEDIRPAPGRPADGRAITTHYHSLLTSDDKAIRD